MHAPSRPQPNQAHQPTTAQLMRGFSLMETMVTVSIMAILAALAAPIFQALINKWHVYKTVEDMKSTIYYARSEAIKRGGGLGVQKNPKTTPGCALADTKEDWGCGWFIFVDSNGNGTKNANEEILQTITPAPNVNVTHRNGGTNIKVDRYGKMSGLNAKGFIFSPVSTGIASPATRGICMASGGRIRVIEDVPCSNK